jgi:SAM-dependent methyltransferase
MDQSNAEAQLRLWPTHDQGVAESGYRPLPSVWEGDDAELIEQMVAFYSRQAPRLILDATLNRGRFWRNSRLPVIGMDLERSHRPNVVGDNRQMPFADEVFDLVVYDPPHVPNQGKDRSKDFNTRFGLVFKSPASSGYNFSYLYPPFLAEAYRVLAPEGLVFAKIADYVHGHRFQWAHLEFVTAAAKAGFMPCDCIVKIRRGPIICPRWRNAHHARRQHCYWIVLRKSPKCE